MTRLPISVCLISGPEALRISRALESVAGWTSEIIVVLNEEVHDSTEEIARQHGAQVFREPWKGYLAQKNSASDKATQPWVFNLDADETVSPQLRDELLNLFADETRIASFTAFNSPRLSWFCGRWIRHGDWYPDRLTRLWRRGQARWGGVDPHARLLVDGPVGRLNGDLHHYSTESIDRRVQKIIPFSDEFVHQHVSASGTPGSFDLVVRPLWRFMRAYFIRLGFLDGWQGYYIASHTAFSTLVRYAKLREAREGAQVPKEQGNTAQSNTLGAASLQNPKS
jgi:glycosyltransferase involved in cell wall biosynthesis